MATSYSWIQTLFPPWSISQVPPNGTVVTQLCQGSLLRPLPTSYTSMGYLSGQGHPEMRCTLHTFFAVLFVW